MASLILGLISWALPIRCLTRLDKSKYKNWAVLSILSMFCCSVALYLQIMYYDFKVQAEDWSALMDVSDNAFYASSVLIVVTALLNLSVVVLYSRRRGREI